MIIIKVEFEWGKHKEIIEFEFNKDLNENEQHNEIMLELMNWVYIKTNANYTIIEH